ncbi:MAG: MltA domain-containing protein [Deltaproteobacteria bacterium]|nr:MltA domain-containing protein [Deltaproteobacteria bacterium]MBW1793034.1 MltA domain-containing protein [Deltaproteobacteria bacterium]
MPFKRFDVRHTRYPVLLGLLLLLAACVPEVKPPVTAPQALVKLQPHQFPDFSDDMSYGSLKTAIDQSLDYLKRLDASTSFCFGPDTFTASHLTKSMKAFHELIKQTPSADKLRKAIETSFWVYRSLGSDGRGKVLFTGYYEPVLQGSLYPSPDYPCPVYRKPRDWVSVNLGLFNPKYAGERIIGRYVNQTVIPCFSREDIDSRGHLRQKGCELLWVSDRIDLFFLHIQGSGQVLLDDDTVLHVNYDCSNGRPYRSIGRLLIDEGSISEKEMSMQQIRAYLRNHPEEMTRVFNHNESYVFFRLVDQGPMGAIEVPLTPGRSVATDLRLFPKGALAFIQTEKPLVDEDGTIQSWQTFGRFVLNQDTGGAIRGPGRADLFWGSGLYAETAAGHMKHQGTLYFLVLKQVGEK